MGRIEGGRKNRCQNSRTKGKDRKPGYNLAVIVTIMNRTTLGAGRREESDILPSYFTNQQSVRPLQVHYDVGQNSFRTDVRPPFHSDLI